MLMRGIQVPRQGTSYRHQALLYPKCRHLRSKRYATNGTVELHCPLCESLHLTAAALGLGNPTVRAFNFNYHSFLMAWNAMIKETKLRESLETSVPSTARHSGPPIDDAFVTRTRKEITDRGRWNSDHSVLRNR